MYKRIFAPTLFLGIIAIALSGCADPAANKPAAEVSEPAADTPAASTATNASSATLAFSDESAIGFVGSKVTGSHDGGFNEFDGSVTVPDGDITKAQIHVAIDMNSTWSDNDRLTGHLKSDDFFGVETHPESSFTSTSIEKTDEGYTVRGNLTLHGVTKEIAFPATIDYSDGKLTADAEFSINRFDFDIKYPGKPDDLIREDVVLKLHIVAS